MGPSLIPDHLDAITKHLKQIRSDTGNSGSGSGGNSDDSSESGLSYQTGRLVLTPPDEADNSSNFSQTDEEKAALYTQFKELLSDAIALGAVKSCIFDTSNSI